MQKTEPAMMTRRSTLRWAGASALALSTAAGPMRAYAATGTDELAALPSGYGKDPDLFKRDAPWPHWLGPRRRIAVERLADHLVPGQGDIPNPSDLDIAAFFDEWTGAPYPEQIADRAALIDILATLDGYAGGDWSSLDARGREAVIERVEAAGTEVQRASLRRLTLLTLAAVYTSPAGIRAIGFVGNEPRERFGGPPPDVLAKLEDAAEALRPMHSDDQP